VKARILVQCWRLIERYHIYEADALQILSANDVGVDTLYTGDKLIHVIVLKEGAECQYLGPYKRFHKNEAPKNKNFETVN